ncbi:hypothetical protein [Fervidicoccus fontis]|uniref:Uncharacterized protein n=1 Tax=Fervidicoccus fontis TaxID=683846 RepID=A0A2J6N434_9CREN|nr:hypothetical protein [Fervidicoccus fontis]PMB76102.1 MAG: hypothetical protein C0188_00315 [Fervidicoccus fontis]HEW64391.1 hypothetical protein [Fervidicoccus fontis]
MEKMRKKSKKLFAGTVSGLLFILLTFSFGNVFTISSAESTNTSSVMTTTAQGSQVTNQTAEQVIVNSINNIIDYYKSKGLNTSQLELLLTQFISALQSGEQGKATQIYIEIVKEIYILRLQQLNLSLPELKEIAQIQLNNIVTQLIYRINNMSFLDSQVKANLTQQLNQALNLINQGNYTGASIILKNVVKELNDMENSIKEAKIQAELSDLGIKRINEINSMFNTSIVNSTEILNVKNIREKAMAVRGLGIMQREMEENIQQIMNQTQNQIENSNLSSVISKDEINKTIIQYMQGEPLSKKFGFNIFTSSEVLLRVAQNQLENYSYGKGISHGNGTNVNQTQVEILTNYINSAENLVMSANAAVLDLSATNAQNAFSSLQQISNQTEQLISELSNITVDKQLNSVKVLILNALKNLDNSISLILSFESQYYNYTGLITVKGIVISINQNNLTVLGGTPLIQPMTNEVKGLGAWNKMIPTEWTVIILSNTKIKGNLTQYAPVIVIGNVTDIANHIVDATSIHIIENDINDFDSN